MNRAAGGGVHSAPSRRLDFLCTAVQCSHKRTFEKTPGVLYWVKRKENEVFCMILQNALVYTPRHTFERGTIIIRDGRIVPFAAPEEGEEVLDAEGLYALPGLVDIHFHGAMGKDFCDGTE